MPDKTGNSRLNVTTDGLTVQIIFPRRIERAPILFVLSAFVIIALFLYLLKIAETNADTDNPSFFIIMKLIFYGIGSILFSAMIYESVKREVIVVNRYNLIIKYSFLNFFLFERLYELKHIKDIRLADTPTHKEKTIEKYDDSFHRWHTYSSNSTKANPTIQFEYKGEIVPFATSLTSAEAQVVIGLISKKIEQLNHVM